MEKSERKRERRGRWSLEIGRVREIVEREKE